MILSRYDKRITRQCRFCGSKDSRLVTLDEGVFGDLSVFVECNKCKARGSRYGVTTVTVDNEGRVIISTIGSIDIAEKKAIKAWNEERP